MEAQIAIKLSAEAAGHALDTEKSYKLTVKGATKAKTKESKDKKEAAKNKHEDAQKAVIRANAASSEAVAYHALLLAKEASEFARYVKVF